MNCANCSTNTTTLWRRNNAVRRQIQQTSNNRYFNFDHCFILCFSETVAISGGAGVQRLWTLLQTPWGETRIREIFFLTFIPLKINRPPSKKNDGIRSRKRKPKNSSTPKVKRQLHICSSRSKSHNFQEPRKQSKSKAPVNNNNRAPGKITSMRSGLEC